MAKVNVPFDLEPWCEGCPELDPTTGDILVTSLGTVKMPRNCTHLSACRWAVASARKLDKGGDADG